MATPLRIILVCDSAAAKTIGEGNCHEKGGETLYQRIQEYIQQHQLEDHYIVRISGCLRQCAMGISVKVLPDGDFFHQVTPENLSAIFEKSDLYPKSLL